MLYLLFHAQKSKFVIDTTYVVEIIHRVIPVDTDLNTLQFEGLINFRGELVPLLDFCRLYSGLKAAPCIDSRIMILESLDERKIGVLAEGVTKTIKVNRNDFLENRVETKQSPYITGIWNTPDGVVKNVDVPLLSHICYEGVSYG